MVEQEIKLNYPIAKNHQIIQILPQFRPVKRGARKKGIERIYVSKDRKSKAKIKMFKELDIADQDLLLAILAISLPIERGKLLDEESQHQHLLDKLKIEPKNNFLIQTLMIETTPYELLKELGKSATGKSNYKWVFDSLERLADTTLYLETKDFIGNTNLISYHFDKKTKKLYIALNPLNAIVLLNDKKGYILNNRKERLSLKGDVARALHAVLLTLIDNNQSKTFNIEILIEKVYLTKFEELNKNQKKDSKKAIKKALEEINKLDNFQIEIYDNNTINIKRYSKNKL